jgi:ribose-phosphate pyrophosphokinase
LNLTVPDLLLFALDATRRYAESIAEGLGMALAPHEERVFEDGEHKCRPLVNVRGRDVYIVQSLYGEPGLSVNDKLMRMLSLLGAVRDAGAGRITAVTPLLCYARKDRKSQPRDPVMTRYVAALFEAVGVDGLLTLDVHNLAAFQNAFRCRTVHLDAGPLFVEWILSTFPGEALAVVSPDAGGMKRAERLRRRLAESTARPVASGFAEKYRAGGVVSGEAFVGEIAGCVAIVLDDLIATGTTMTRTIEACMRHGAKAAVAVATHGLFVGRAAEVLGADAVAKVVVTDTVPPFRVPAGRLQAKLEVLASGPLVAEAVRRLHANESLLDIGQDD